MPLRVLESSPQRLRVEAEGDERVLAPVVARNVSVVRTQLLPAKEDVSHERLSALRFGERCRVIDISRACQGPQRRRLLDVGILPGTEIRAEISAPSGDPTAYRVRGAAIALRREQADLIQVERIEGGR
jgi:DtxR family Mn-dependent transcriptional regulator